jgi:Arc/MetJ family transcription regulator
MARVAKARGTSDRPRIRRKNVNIDQHKLDRAVKILGARSETDAIDQALELVVFRDELIEGIRRMAGTGGVEDYFDDSPDW